MSSFLEAITEKSPDEKAASLSRTFLSGARLLMDTLAVAGIKPMTF